MASNPPGSVQAAISVISSAVIGAALGKLFEALKNDVLGMMTLFALVVVGIIAIVVLAYTNNLSQYMIILSIICLSVFMGVTLSVFRVANRVGDDRIPPGPVFVTVVTTATPDAERQVPPQAEQTIQELTRFASVTATDQMEAGQDSCGVSMSYQPANIIDGASKTAWRVAGNGAGQSITLSFPTEVVVTEVRVIPGYAKIDPCKDHIDRCTWNRIPRHIKISFSNGTYGEIELDQNCGWQGANFDKVKTRSVRLTIMDSYGLLNKNGREITSISEVSVFGYAP